MDTYTKIILTIIALSLATIAYKMPIPKAEASMFSGAPTLGEFRKQGLSAQERKNLTYKIPVVWVKNIRQARN